MAKKQGGGKLLPLSFTTFGEIAAFGLEVHVSCTKCHSSRLIDLLDRLRDRCFAGARFSCTAVRLDGEICGGLGTPAIRPPTLIPVGGGGSRVPVLHDVPAALANRPGAPRPATVVNR
jgi:hypothetical protein